MKSFYFAILGQLVFGRGCFNHKSIYQINVKVFLDQNSQLAIVNHMRNVFPLKNHNEPYDFELLHLKRYFEMIFKNVNKTLSETNVQFRADLSNVFRKERLDFESKYCGHFRNIVSITETFLSDFKEIDQNGENKLLIIDCSEKNTFLPSRNHFATQNLCEKTHGILLTDPEKMKGIIAEGLYRIFTKKSISEIQDTKQALKADVCSYIQFCNRNFDYIGTFINESGSLEHNAEKVKNDFKKVLDDEVSTLMNNNKNPKN